MLESKIIAWTSTIAPTNCSKRFSMNCARFAASLPAHFQPARSGHARQRVVVRRVPRLRPLPRQSSLPLQHRRLALAQGQLQRHPGVSRREVDRPESRAGERESGRAGDDPRCRACRVFGGSGRPKSGNLPATGGRELPLSRSPTLPLRSHAPIFQPDPPAGPAPGRIGRGSAGQAHRSPGEAVTGEEAAGCGVRDGEMRHVDVTDTPLGNASGGARSLPLSRSPALPLRGQRAPEEGQLVAEAPAVGRLHVPRES